jgi:hypothetical protein
MKLGHVRQLSPQRLKFMRRLIQSSHLLEEGPPQHRLNFGLGLGCFCHADHPLEKCFPLGSDPSIRRNWDVFLDTFLHASPASEGQCDVRRVLRP